MEKFCDNDCFVYWGVIVFYESTIILTMWTFMMKLQTIIPHTLCFYKSINWLTFTCKWYFFIKIAIYVYALALTVLVNLYGFLIQLFNVTCYLPISICLSIYIIGFIGEHTFKNIYRHLQIMSEDFNKYFYFDAVPVDPCQVVEEEESKV